MENLFGIILVLFVAVLWICVFIRKIAGAAARIKSAPGTIIKKQQYKKHILSAFGTGAGRDAFAVTFSLKNGGERTFEVPKGDYMFYKVRQSGTLIYKDTKLLEFRR